MYSGGFTGEPEKTRRKIGICEVAQKMLKYPAMRFTGRFFAVLLVALVLLAARQAPVAGPVRIDTPRTGETLRGRVSVTGSTAVEGFQSAELSFAEEANPTNWFLMNASSKPVQSGELFAWDTTALADGTYRLRLTVLQKDGASQEALVTGLVVSNGGTPTPAAQAGQRGDSSQGFALLPTPTRGPKNPATVGEVDLMVTMVRGVIFTLAIFGVLGLYVFVRGLFRDR